MFPAGVAGLRTRYVVLPGGIRLRIVEAGEPSAAPVLLLHGWGASLYMWRDWFAPLAAAGFRPIAVDLPGHGLSDKPDDPAVYRLEALVAVVRALIDAERLQPLRVVAQSMAGTIALELTLSGESRVSQLVLINPSCFGEVRLQRIGRLLSPGFVGPVLPHLVPRWSVARAHKLVYGNPSSISPRDVDEYWAPSQFPGYARAMRRLVHEFPWSRTRAAEMAGRLRALASPALVVLGGCDRLVRDSGSYVTELVKRGALLEIRKVEQGGHAVNEELPEVVVPLALARFSAEDG